MKSFTYVELYLCVVCNMMCSYEAYIHSLIFLGVTKAKPLTCTFYLYLVGNFLQVCFSFLLVVDLVSSVQKFNISSPIRLVVQ